MQRPQDPMPKSKPAGNTRPAQNQSPRQTNPASNSSRTPTNRLTATSSGDTLLSAAAVVLPLRLFLGISFVAAGLDKLADPQFLDPSAGGYIGAQLTGFAAHSPLKVILTNLAIPNATFFGIVVMLGEFAIGLGTLLGLFTRTAAFFGVVLSFMLWLTASWEVTPFFLGSDLPYAIGWLVLLIAGAHPVFSLDGQLQKRKAQNTPVKGVEVVQGWNQPLSTNATNSGESVAIARRRFLLLTGSLVVAGMATGIAWAKTWHDENEGSSAAGDTSVATTPQPQPPSSAGSSSPNPAVTAANTIPAQTPASKAPSAQATSNPTSAQPSPAANTTAPSTTSAPTISGKVLANVGTLAVGAAQKFTTPDTREPAILIREPDGSVKAFSTICTHEGCELDYVKTAQALVCPCHGAQFSAQTGEVTRRPARRPLKSFKVQVDGSGNIVYSQAQ